MAISRPQIVPMEELASFFISTDLGIDPIEIALVLRASEMGA
jgi:hypothetical protein